MKFKSPRWLIISTSFIITVVFAGVLLMSCLLLKINIPFLLYIILFSSIFIITYVLFTFLVKYFIHEKIKLIYKTIQKHKLSKEEKAASEKKLNMNDDVIGNVQNDVDNWAEQQRQEIEHLIKHEEYRREFLGNVSHELKTPIFNIQGYILTLLDGALNDPGVNKSYLEKAEKNIERMINIVHDLEIISQLESGMLKLQYSKFDIITLTVEIFEMLEMKAKKKNIRLFFNEAVENETSIYVSADKERTKQVLLNLIENTIKYGNDNGRTKLSFYDMDENILVEVSDNGIGIEDDDLPRLFERFYRVDKSRSRSIGGSGLGLSIVKHIIESHQQTINVRSTPGVGSTFSFTLKKA